MRFGDELTEREASQLARVQVLGRARAELAGLRQRAWQTLLADESTSAVVRGSGEEQVLVLIHRGREARTLTIPVPASAWSEGTRLRDRLGGLEAVVRGGAMDITLPAFSAAYLAAE